MAIIKQGARMQFWPLLLLFTTLLLYPVTITAHILPTHTRYLNNNNGPTSTASLASTSFPSPSPTATAHVNLVPRTAIAPCPTALHHATDITTPLPFTKAPPDSSGASASDDTYVATTDTMTILATSTPDTSSLSLSAAAYDLVQEVAGIPRDASPFPLPYDDHAARPAVDLQHRQPLHVVNGSADVSFDSMDNNLPVKNTSGITHSETESVRAGSNVEPTFAEPDRLVTPELDRMNIVRRLALSSQERPRVVRVYGPVQGVTIAFSSSWSWNTQKNPRLTDPITEEWYAAIENMERKGMALDASRRLQEAATAEAEQKSKRADDIIATGRKQSLELAAQLQHADGIAKATEKAYRSQVSNLAYARKYAFVQVMGAFMFKRNRDMTSPYSTAMTIYQRPLYPPLPPLLLWFCQATTWNVKAGKWLRQVALVLQKVAWMLQAVLQQASLDVRQAWLALQDAVAILLCWLAFIYVVLGNSACSSATPEFHSLPGSYDGHLQVSGLGDVGSEFAMDPVNERNDEQTNEANDTANEPERTNEDGNEQRGRQTSNLVSRATQWPTEDSRIIQRILLKNGRYHQRARSWSPIRAAGSSIRDRNRITGVEPFAVPSRVASLPVVSVPVVLVPVVSVPLVEQAAEPVTPAFPSDLATSEPSPDPNPARCLSGRNDNKTKVSKATEDERVRPDGLPSEVTSRSMPSAVVPSQSEFADVDVVAAVSPMTSAKAEVQSNVTPPGVSEAREQALPAQPDVETRVIVQTPTPSDVPFERDPSPSLELPSNVHETLAPVQPIVPDKKLAARVENAVNSECPVQGAHIIVSTPVHKEVKGDTATPVNPPSEAAIQSAVERARVFSQGSLPPSAVQVCDTAPLSSTVALPDATNAAVDASVVDVVTVLVQVQVDSTEVTNAGCCAAPAPAPPVRKLCSLPRKVRGKISVRTLHHERAIPAPVGNGTLPDLDFSTVENQAPGPVCFETALTQSGVSAAVNPAPRRSSDKPVRNFWMPEAKRPCRPAHLGRPSFNPVVDSARRNLASFKVQNQIFGPGRLEGDLQHPVAFAARDVWRPLASTVPAISSSILQPIGVNTMMPMPVEVVYPPSQAFTSWNIDGEVPYSAHIIAADAPPTANQMPLEVQEPMAMYMDAQEPMPMYVDMQESMSSPTYMDVQEPMGSPMYMVVQSTPAPNVSLTPSQSFDLETPTQSFVLDTPTPATRVPPLGELRNYSPSVGASLDSIRFATARPHSIVPRPAVQPTNLTRLSIKPIERVDVFSERAFHASISTALVSVPAARGDLRAESQMEVIAEESEVDEGSERGGVESEASSCQILSSESPTTAMSVETGAGQPEESEMALPSPNTERSHSWIPVRHKPETYTPEVCRTMSKVVATFKLIRRPSFKPPPPVPPFDLLFFRSKRRRARKILVAARQMDVEAEENEVFDSSSEDLNGGNELAASEAAMSTVSIRPSRSEMTIEDDVGLPEGVAMTDEDYVAFFDDDSDLTEDDNAGLPEDSAMTDDEEDVPLRIQCSRDVGMSDLDENMAAETGEDIPLSNQPGLVSMSTSNENMVATETDEDDHIDEDNQRFYSDPNGDRGMFHDAQAYDSTPELR